MRKVVLNLFKNMSTRATAGRVSSSVQSNTSSNAGTTNFAESLRTLWNMAKDKPPSTDHRNILALLLQINSNPDFRKSRGMVRYVAEHLNEHDDVLSALDTVMGIIEQVKGTKKECPKSEG